jgi:L-methionine (R)-S-oxide reductase
MQTRHAQAESEYTKIIEQVHTFLADERDLIANAANFSALLFEALEAVDWVGFYFLREAKFILGPFQGHAVKSSMPLVGNTAGRALGERRSIIAENNTQVFVPLIMNDRNIGVLDIHSPFTGRFNEQDLNGLEALAQVLIDQSNMKPLLAARTQFGEILPKSAASASPAQPTSASLARERLEHVTSVKTVLSSPMPIDPVRETAREISVKLRRFVTRTLPLARALAPSLPGAALLALAAALPPIMLRQNGALLGFAIVAHAFSCVIALTILGAMISTVRRMSVRNTAYFTTAYAALLSMILAPHGIFTAMPTGWLNIAGGLIGGYLGGTIGRGLRRRLQIHQRVAELHRP